MLITRQLVRTLVLALPLTVAAYSQAMVHYGAAVTAGTAAGAAAGKGASDALTKVMNGAAASGQTANNSAEVAAAEAQMMKKQQQAKADAAKAKAEGAKGKPEAANVKPEAVKPASEYKSVTKPANMPTGDAGPSSPSASNGGVSQAKSSAMPPPIQQGGKTSAKKEAQLLASVADTVSPLSGKPVARTRRGTHVAAVEPVLQPAAAEPVAPAYEMPLSMRQEMDNFHPALEPLADRLQRIAKGDTRDDVKRILGLPASKVTIPADRDVSEIYYYQEKGRIVATIRLEAGTVTKVNVI
jgi:hypothetical protein